MGGAKEKKKYDKKNIDCTHRNGYIYTGTKVTQHANDHRTLIAHISGLEGEAHVEMGHRNKMYCSQRRIGLHKWQPVVAPR